MSVESGEQSREQKPPEKNFSEGTDEPRPKQISKTVAEIMGKRGWEIKKIENEDDRFFKLNKNEFEDEDLLRTRKEIWDWCVLCIEGENKKLFCHHLLREVKDDKWDIQLLSKN